jgi:hypothetical protein
MKLDTRLDLPFYVHIGIDQLFRYECEIPAPDIRTAIKKVISIIKNHKVDMHQIAGGLWLYLGRCGSTLKDGHICKCNFDGLSECKGWCTSPEMCGVDVSIKKGVTKSQFVKYASVYKHWTWRIDTSDSDYIGKYHDMLLDFKRTDKSGDLGQSKIQLTVKNMNLFDKLVKNERVHL